MNDSRVLVHPQAVAESDAIGKGTRIWALTHVGKGAALGADCNVGEGGHDRYSGVRAARLRSLRHYGQRAWPAGRSSRNSWAGVAPKHSFTIPSRFIVTPHTPISGFPRDGFPSRNA